LANNIEDPRNTILVVGYCSPTTLGARIVSGENPGSIFGEKHPVRATVERIEAFSSHGDYTEMKDYVSCQDRTQLKEVFLVHGEIEAQQFYQGKLEEAGFRGINILETGTELQL
jgi:metallo-beta-lactamase family protein